MRVPLRQYALSIAVFAVIIGGLVSVDDRVRAQFASLSFSSRSLTPWGDQIGSFLGALVTAVRHQSIENAPLVVFATVGGILFIFMFRT